MICPFCDAENADDAVFCTKCGAKLVPSPPNSSETSSLPDRSELRPISIADRQAETSVNGKTVPFGNRSLQFDLKKLGEWIGVGVVCALLLWFVYIPASIIWAYSLPDLKEDALWSFRGRHANGVRTTGYILGDEPTVLMTVERLEGLAKDYYFVAWDDSFEQYVAVRCDETTFRRIKSEKSFRLKGVVRTLHKEIAKAFKKYGEDMTGPLESGGDWNPTMRMPGKCIDMTGMKGFWCLFLALMLAFPVPLGCAAGYRFWKKTRENSRRALRCANCGVRLGNNARFCTFCGTPAPIKSSPEATEEKYRRGADDGNSLPKPLQYLLATIVAFSISLIYFVFYQRYWEIEWITLR